MPAAGECDNGHSQSHPLGAAPTGAPALELWAGIECTVNRVGDSYLDQIEASGHAHRLDDLDRVAGLGVRTLRYPVLWERTAPDGLERADWTWADERLGHLRSLGVRPIVGLVHHGSGPRHTSLVDPAFPAHLAAYARAVAQRYPWVDRYTPVNEPLTTARFSGLYGHWYPHGQDALTFVRVLLTECRAVALAMAAIREVNPRAQLVQTDDLGKTYSTPTLAYQADFDNERRWLTWDLLCGRVRPGHRMWQFLIRLGIPAGELEWFLDHPCPSDVLGINYYITSGRFLDHRLERYPQAFHGGNGRHRYADVEAVRVLANGLPGPAALLQEAWERYQVPVAITEAHLGSTREEQMRWLVDVWHGAQDARAAGVDVQAVTVWSLFGAYDWDSLVTRPAGHYEPGAFDLRGARPRATALAGLLSVLAADREPSHPVLDSPGWWRRPEQRLLYPSVRPQRRPEDGASRQRGASTRSRRRSKRPPRPLVITGAAGALGDALGRLCTVRGLEHRLLASQDVDIADPEAVDCILSELEPWALVHAAGCGHPAPEGREATGDRRASMESPAVLAAGAARRGVRLLTFSSDLVFDGGKDAPYVESDPVAPQGVYGRRQAEGETCVLATLPAALVVRTGPLFGPWDEHNFVSATLRRLASGRPVAVVDDALVSPTYIPDLVDACLDLLVDGECGRWHLANVGAVTWHELAGLAAGLAGVSTSRLEPPAMRTGGQPRFGALGSERGALLPPLDVALQRYIRDRRAAHVNRLPDKATPRAMRKRTTRAAA